MAEPRRRRTIDFPTLNHLLGRTDPALGPTIAVLRRTHALVFPIARPPEGLLDQWDALHMARLICTLEQIDLLSHIDDLDIVAIGDRCPEQIACYALCLERVILRARDQGADLRTLWVLQQTRTVLSRLRDAITPTFGGLS